MLRYFFLCLALFFNSAWSFTNAFYALRADQSAAIEQHHQQISELILQAYFTSENNVINGSVDQATLNAAKKYHIPVFAQVTNYEFDNKIVHQFLQSDALQQKAIASLVTDCQNNQLQGVQIDFEHLSQDDKDAFTNFISNLVDAMHAQHLEVSVAVLPLLYQTPPTAYYKLLNKDWTGAYDIPALAKLCDFITVMAYDQHIEYTTPGPVASYEWDERIIKNYLENLHLPAAKFSLGIPTYSAYWHMHRDGGSIDAQGYQISYDDVMRIMQKFHLQKIWDPRGKFNYIVFDPYFIYRYLFIEDADSMRAKLNLAKRYHLYGASVFRLGDEDPRIWYLFD